MKTVDAPPKSLNYLYGDARFYTPDDVGIVTPNNDTPYSRGYLDIKNGWRSLEIPASPELDNRYLSFQCIDCFTNNVCYISEAVSPISSGRKTGKFLFYKGERPAIADEKEMR